MKNVRYHATKYSSPEELEAKLNSLEHPEAGDVIQVLVNTVNQNQTMYTLLWKSYEEEA